MQGPSLVSLHRGILPRESLRDFCAYAACHVKGLISYFPISYPGFPGRSYLPHGSGAHLPSSPWPRRGILTRQELPGSPRTPAQSRSLLAWHSRAVAACDVAPCVCPRRDSCQRGWRLLYIVAAYHSCSGVLQPYLVRFLQDVSRTPGLPFQGEGLGSGDPGLWACLHGDWLGSQWWWWWGARRGPGPSHALGQCLLILIPSPNICRDPTGADAMGCPI